MGAEIVVDTGVYSRFNSITVLIREDNNRNRTKIGCLRQRVLSRIDTVPLDTTVGFGSKQL